MSLVGVRDIIGTTRENSSIYVYIINTISTIGVQLLNHRSPYTSEIADALGIVKSTVYK